MIESSTQNINRWLTHLNPQSKFHISVDCAIFGYEVGKLKVLLMECDFPLYKGKWSLVGDLIKPDETVQAAAERVLYENTNLDKVYLEQVESFSRIDRHPLGRVITMAYYSLINTNSYYINHPDYLKLEWVDMKDISELAFDHSEILRRCYDKLKTRVRLTPVVFDLLPKKFSLMQLQRLYETILDVEIDKRNFRRRINNQGYLVDVGENQDDVSHRPAKLYSFDREKFMNHNQGKLNLMI